MRGQIFNVQASFNTLLKAHVSAIQNEINAVLGTAHVLKFFSQRQVNDYPAVRTWFFSHGGINPRTHRFESRVQVDVFTKNATPEAPDQRLPNLLCDSLLQKLGFTGKRANLDAYFPIGDFTANPVTPQRGLLCRVSMDTPEGWSAVPDPDPTVYHCQIDFKISYRA